MDIDEAAGLSGRNPARAGASAVRTLVASVAGIRVRAATEPLRAPAPFR